MKIFRILTLLAMLVFISSCAWLGFKPYDSWYNSKKLRVGMSKQQVLKIMGRPLKDKAYNKPNIWYYYITPQWRDGYETRDECMPLVFKDGKLAGWGNEYYNRLLETNKIVDVKD